MVALLGCSATPSQQALLATAPKVLVMLDGDAAGRHGARTIARALPCRCTWSTSRMAMTQPTSPKRTSAGY